MFRPFPALLPAWLCLTASVQAGDTALEVTSATEIPQVWQAGQHLYRKGNTGLSADALRRLEAWLDTHAPHWTVVIMADADGEFWKDPGGETFSGMDAVENVLGRGLPAETGFGTLTNPRTGERDGAWFVLFLRERNMSYWAADAYDQRGLGEDHWQGNLDGPARQAMRGGGRTADAVQDTVTSIDGELRRRIDREETARRQEQERRERLRAGMESAIGETRQTITWIGEQAATRKRDWPGATGPLVQPPAGRWLTSLADAAATLTNGDPDKASATLREVRSAVESWQAQHAAFQLAPDRLTRAERELDSLQIHELSGQARGLLLEARAELRKAQDAHPLADPGTLDLLENAEKLLAAARSADAGIRRLVAEHAVLTDRFAVAAYPQHAEAEGLLRQGREALAGFAAAAEAGQEASLPLKNAAALLERAGLTADAADRHATMIRRTVTTGGGIGAGALLLGGWAGNRRRRSVKSRALDAFKHWEETLTKKTGELFTLLDRAGRAIGTSATLDSSGWTGTTRDLARRTIQDVDQLFVMSSSLDQVLEQARALIHPENPLLQAGNAVSGSRYTRALKLLEQEQIVFSPDTQIPDIIRGAPQQEWRGLLGRKEDCEPFTLTFTGLNEAFNDRAGRALAALDRIETAWLQAEDSLTELDTSIAAAAAAERKVNEREAADRRFGVNALFDPVLPEAREDLATATRLAVTDPVQALDGPVAEGRRKSGEALTFCQAVLSLRESLLPALHAAEKILAAAGRESGWIGAALDSLSGHADRLAGEAVARSVTADIADWESAAGMLRDRVQATVELVHRATGESHQAIVDLESLVAGERRRTGTLLNLPADQMLAESGRNPDGWISRARHRHTASLTELDRGDPAAATTSLDGCATLCREARELVEDSAAALADFAGRAGTLEAELSRVISLIPARSAELADLMKNWAPAALHPALADPSCPDPGETVADNIRVAGELMEQVRTDLNEAEHELNQGAPLSAAARQDAADAGLETAAAALNAIPAQAAALTAAAAANRALRDRLMALRAELSRLAEEPVTMQATRRDLAPAFQTLLEATAAADAKGPLANPFEAAHSLEAARAALSVMEGRLASDRKLHAEAARSAAAARRQLGAAEPAERQAATDGIVDSPATGSALATLASLRHSLAETEAALALAHGDWTALDEAADRIAAEAASGRARLQNELDEASASLAAVHAAADKVRSAAGWSGLAGVLIPGSPGSTRLEEARRALSSGDYHSARTLGEAAAREARQAIEAAEAEQRRRRQEQERQQEARSRAARRTSGLSSSFPSSRSSGRSGSSSRSSFSSRSGASRSGW